MKKYVLSAVVALGLSFASLAASAFVGAVKVDTFGDLSLTLGTICDTYSSGSHPIGIACEAVADPGSGTTSACGSSSTCTPYGSIVRNDTVGAYCQDTTGNDVIVYCTTSTTPGPLSPPAGAEEQKGK